MEKRMDDTGLEELNSLWRDIDGAYHDLCVSLGLSGSAFDILYALYSLGEGCHQSDICAWAFVGKQTVNTSIHKLVDQGYVTLGRAPRGRGKGIYLTDEGHAMMERLIAPVAQAEACALASLGQDDCREALRIMGAYAAELRRRFAALPPVEA